MSDLKDNNGASISDDKQKAELFNDFFGTMYTLDDQQSMPDKPNLNVTQYLSNIEFVKTEVLKQTEKVEVQKYRSKRRNLLAQIEYIPVFSRNAHWNWQDL